MLSINTFSEAALSCEHQETRKRPLLTKKPTKSTILFCRSLSLSFSGTGRNITADRYFSSFDLTAQLLSQSLTYVGTLRSNKRELQYIPPLLHQSLQVQETQFVFGGPDKQISSKHNIPRQFFFVVTVNKLYSADSAMFE